jgi:outer membrane receptor protein involved in Fe transport
MRISVAVAAACFGFAGVADAAEAPSNAASSNPSDVATTTGLALEEIVVTATKHEESLQDVAIAISAITGDDIRARGLTQYADVLSSVPGVYYEDGGPGDTAIRIRGISSGGGGGTPPTVATYFGEIPLSAQGGGNLGQHGTPRFVDIERVEVLRGPQGTVFGANALAGAVRVIPAAPDLQDYEVELGARSFATAHSGDVSYNAEAALNLPLVQDRFALRLVGYLDDVAGYIDNVTPAQAPFDYSAVVANLTGGAVAVPPGTLMTPATPAIDEEDIDSIDTAGGRVSARLQASDRLRFDLMFGTQSAEMNSESGVAPGGYDVARTLDLFASPRTEENLDLAGLTITYDWDSVSLTSVSSYTKLEMARVNDAAFIVPPMVPWYFDEHRDSDAVTQEVRLTSRGDGAFTWTVGAFYLDRDTDGAQYIGDYSCSTTPMCLPYLFTQGAQDFALNLDFHLFEKQKAVFVDTSYEFASRWTFGVGGRYLEEDIGVRLDTVGFLAPPLLPGATNGGEDSASKFNPAASLRFKPNDDLTFYVQAAEGFRSGVANQSLPLTCQQQAAGMGLALQTVTDPDTVTNYELGMKSVLGGGRFNVNVAAYSLEWRDIPGAVTLPCGFSTIVNAGDASGEGVELEFVGMLSDSWRVNLSASYNDLTYDDNVLPAIGSSGDRVKGSPDKNYSAGLEYAFNLGGAWSGSARADWAYVGSVEPDLGGGPPAPALEAYDTLNMRLGFRTDTLAVELFGRNVTDERAVSSVEPFQFGSHQTLIRPREVGLEVRYSYR